MVRDHNAFDIITNYTRCWQNYLLGSMNIEVVLTQIDSVFNLKLTDVLEVRKRLLVLFCNGINCVKKKAHSLRLMLITFRSVFPLGFSCMYISGFPFFDSCWRDSLKGTKRNTFIPFHVLLASLNMSKRPKDEGGSQTSHMHIKRLWNTLFKSRTRRRFNYFSPALIG